MLLQTKNSNVFDRVTLMAASFFIDIKNFQIVMHDTRLNCEPKK